MFLRLAVLFSLLGVLSACSNAQKIRMQERERISNHSGLFCDFVNGDEYPDVEVELNLQMARRCDANKAFTISDYKNGSDAQGMLFCCALPRKEEKKSENVLPPPAKPEARKEKLKIEAEPVADIKPDVKPEAKVEAKAEAKAESKTEVKQAAPAAAPKAEATPAKE